MTPRSWIRKLFARTPRTVRKAPARFRPRVEGDWYATPEPIVTIDGPSADRADEKAQFEREHLARWFGARART